MNLIVPDITLIRQGKRDTYNHSLSATERLLPLAIFPWLARSSRSLLLLTHPRFSDFVSEEWKSRCSTLS